MSYHTFCALHKVLLTVKTVYHNVYYCWPTDHRIKN